MKTFIQLYETIKQKVDFLSKQLQFGKFRKLVGRKLAITIEESISLALFKQKNNIATKKSVYEIFHFPCSYKTLVVNMNRWSYLAMIILALFMKINRKNQHPIKHIDSTEIPVCLFKNAHAHKTMKELACFGKSSRGTFFGLKLHIITDLKRKLLSVKFSSGNIDDRKMVIPLSSGLEGIFIADAGYVSKKLSQEFYQEHKRILLAQPRKNMKKIMTEFENILYGTRMLIEINFRCLKMFYGLVTSLPRSVGGYLANYIYALLAYQIA